MKLFDELTGKRTAYYLLLFVVISLSIIPIIRFADHDSILLGQSSYYHARIAEQISEHGPIIKDALMSRYYTPDIYHIILALAILIIGKTLAFALIPFVLGLFSVILFNKIIKQLFSPALAFISTMILIFSPPFIYAFSTLNYYSLPIALILAGFLFFLKNDKNSYKLTLIFFLFIAVSDMINSIIFALLLLSYSLINKPRQKEIFSLTIKGFSFSLLFHLLLFLLIGSSKRMYLDSSPFILNLISDLGGLMGFGIFALLLAIIGFYQKWKTKKQPLLYLIILILFISTFFYTQINLYLNFIFAFASAVGLSHLIKIRWNVKLIKQLTILLLICGLFFSFLSYSGRICSLQPDKEIVESLEWLKSQPKGIVLTYPPFGFWIESIAEKPVVVDMLLSKKPQNSAAFIETNATLYSRNLEKTEAFLIKNNVSYIWINQDMKQGLVWTKEDQGILFLLQNSKKFEKIYSNKESEIWKFNPVS